MRKVGDSSSSPSTTTKRTVVPTVLFDIFIQSRRRGAGIFASIVCGATPLNAEKWAVPQRLAAECLRAIAEVGGPRCCKRTGRLAIECAAEFSEREFGVAIACSRPKCGYSLWNTECIRQKCPYFPQKDA